MNAATYFTEVVALCGTTRANEPIERCNGDFKQTWLLMPGTGVYFLVDRTRLETRTRRASVPARATEATEAAE